MNLEIKPVYNDFFNKIKDDDNNYKNIELDNKNSCKLDEISSEQEVFVELKKILKSKNPKKYKLDKHKINQHKSINISEDNKNTFEKNNFNNNISNSDNYTNSSGLNKDILILKNMYLQNITKIENNNNEINTELKSKFKQNVNEESVSLVDTISNHSENSQNLVFENIKEIESVDEEFKQFFSKDKKKRLDIDSKEKQFNKLEKFYDKVIKNKLDNKKEKSKEIDIHNYKKKDLVKILLNKIEKEIYLESTRGYNIEQNIYKLNIDKLKLNLSKFNVSSESKCTVGYLYRNYNDPKAYINTTENSHWLEISNTENKVIEKELDNKDKFLNSCLKNFKKIQKFKKQIGSSLYRAHIKTVEIINTKNLVIDIIFFVKYK